MFMRAILVIAGALLASPVVADCPTGMTLYARAWAITMQGYGSTEAVHAQLWNKGTQPIVLKSFSMQPLDTTAPLMVVAGPAGNGDPNQDPLDGTKQRLVKTIVDFAADYAAGFNGSAGGLLGLPPSAQSQHGEMRAQVSETSWLLAQVWHFRAHMQIEPITAMDGFVIPPGHGFTLRAGNPNQGYSVSFSWCEPTQQQSGSLPQPTYAGMLPKRKAPAKKAAISPWWNFK